MDYYYDTLSASCRAPLLTAAALGIKFNLKPLSLLKHETRTPEFIKINPQHTLPTLVDGDFVLWESRAICSYLVNKYGKDDSLYPKDPEKQACVDRLLFFDMGTLYDRFGKYVYPVIMDNSPPEPEKLAKFQESIGWLNDRLKESQYVTGATVTIADHTLVATLSTAVAAGIDMSAHPGVVAWLERCRTLPGYEENDEGAKKFGAMANQRLASK